MSRPDGGPAFPSSPGTSVVDAYYRSGMTLRDYFAAKAMHAILRNNQGVLLSNSFGSLAEIAYAMADSMLAERAK